MREAAGRSVDQLAHDENGVLIGLLKLRANGASQTTSEGLTMIPVSANTAGDPRILIVGGGFGGLAAARALRKSQARVLLDRQD